MNKKKPFSIWKLIKLPPQFLYAIGMGPIYGHWVLLLTTIGRNSGKPRVTPLQYEEIDGDIYVASARGTKSDWYRNIVNNPKVSVRVRSQQFEGKAEPTTDRKRIADFLELRLQRHPIIMGILLKKAGVSKSPNRAELMSYASNRAMVIIKPCIEA